MSFSNFLKRLSGKLSSRPSARRRRGLNLEVMEDRCTPVINVFGTVNPDIITVTQLGNLVAVRVNNMTTLRAFPANEQVRVFAGDGNDAISVSPISANRSVRVNGEAGPLDRLVGPNTPNRWDVTANNSGALNGNVTFLNVESLQGGTAQDRFVFHNQAKLTQVDGAGDYDQLEYPNYAVGVTMSLANRKVTGITNPVLNIEGLVGSTFNDRLIGGNLANTWNVTANNAGNVNNSFFFALVEHLQGGAAQDRFVLSAGVGVSTLR